MNKRGRILFLVVVFLISFLALVDFGNSATSRFSGGTSGYTGVSTYPRASFQTYYGPESRLQTYWPILGDKESCKARQDILLSVSPAGCQPAVVRSDLLAEQNVPVFCQIDSLKMNPLIDIKQINNIRFTGNYPPEISGSGFHPARAALRTGDRLLGSPLVNNIGYVVVVLKRQPEESKLPDQVTVNLTAQIEYNSGNAFGVGKAEFVLEPIADVNWEREKAKQSFWGGRYYVRLEEVNLNFAVVSIYNGDRKIYSTRVESGKTSDEFYVPGLYCQAGLQIAFDGFVKPQDKARVEVYSDDGTDSFDLYQGSRFLDDRCTVQDIKIDSDTESGKVRLSCEGQTFDLSINAKSSSLLNYFENKTEVKITENKVDSGIEYEIDLNKLEGERKGVYFLDTSGRLNKLEGGGKVFVYANGEVNTTLVKDKDWTLTLWKNLKEYKQAKEENPSYDITKLQDNKIEGKAKEYFDKAIESYEKVANDFPYEKQGEAEGSKRFGELSLDRGQELAKAFSMEETRARLLNEYIELYKDGANKDSYLSELNDLYKLDRSSATEVVEFQDRARNIRLVSLSKPKDKGFARIGVESLEYKLEVDGKQDLIKGSIKVGELVLDELTADEARLSAFCSNSTGDISKEILRYRLQLNKPGEKICGLAVVLKSADTAEIAKVRLLPIAKGTETQTTLSVTIGIEKRSIKLTPDKALERIQKLNESIQKWEKISKQLGTTVSGLKAACFATSGLLTFKNFLSGLNGGTLARQEVMSGDSGWRNRCADMVASGKYSTLDACYISNADQIEQDVKATGASLSNVNQKIKDVQDKFTTSDGLFGKSLNSDDAKNALAAKARQDYGSMSVEYMDKDGIKKTSTVNELLSDKNVKSGVVNMEDIRSVMLYSDMKQQGVSSESQKANIDSRFNVIGQRFEDNTVIAQQVENAKKLGEKGYPSPMYVSTDAQRDRVTDVKIANNDILSKLPGAKEEGVSHISTVVAAGSSKSSGGKTTEFNSGTYILGLKESDSRKGIYNVDGVWQEKNGEFTKLESPPAFLSTYGIGNIRAADREIDNNKIVEKDRKIRYYETEPYKGMPAIVPFDVDKGWYAATRQTLPVFGGIGAFDASGRVTSLWICNVGSNGRVEFETGFGDDLCQQVNLNTGQPLGVFPGKSEAESRKLVNDAVRSIEDAARQYGKGNKFVTINGQRFEVGPPTTGVPGTQCQDFMSPKDCNLLFNVCDPVICPSSRCNFGGQYPVANVMQTGIVGSVLLCLPNVREGIAIPVCLTGIQAGIDGLISIMKNYRDCLQENVDTGKMVGICDQIYSVYICEFFWNQVAPVVNVLIPKLIETAYGQGVRGGGEYLTVTAAWQNMQNSMNYFTQSYAVNSINAFKARSDGIYGSRVFESNSVAELGGEFCKVFVSTKAPKAFESLIEPDSPPQFHAWFDSKKFSDVTVPATSQYKVFYHIFAGKDQGTNFDVYLRSPPDSSYYNVAPRVPVASGFIPRGQYASETRDFTAPEGYKELCVRINGEEKCGFKEVTTSFALNQLSDSYASDQIKNNNIQSETECISGQSNLGALATPNIQAGVEGVINPADYNRGIVRICATKNPGLSTDPSRFVSVGFCGDQKVTCWLDKRSVNNAISDSNVLARNATLQELDQINKANLEAEGTVLTDDQADAEFRSLEDAIDDLIKNKDNKEGKVIDLNSRFELIYGMLLSNADRAQLLYLKGQAYEDVALSFKAKEKKTVSGSTENTGTSGVSGNELPIIPVNLDFDLDTADSNGYSNLVLDQTTTNYYEKGGEIFYGDSSGELVKIGSVVSSDGTISVSSDGIDILQSKYLEVNGRKIKNWETKVKEENKGFFAKTVDSVKDFFSGDKKEDIVEAK
ncbi:MAG: hypothetical protein AABY05_00175, partial [Nanoarchaeota archaeon]